MRSKIRLRSLRTKIIAWTLIPTMIILVAVVVVIFYAYQDVTEDLAVERNQDLTRLAAGHLAANLAQYADLLDAEARKLVVYQDDPGALRDVLKGARHRLAAFDGGVLILDTFGKVVAAAPGRPDVLGQNWADRAYYRRVLRSSISGTPERVFSDIMPDGTEGTEAVVVAVPMMGSHGEFAGAIVGMLPIGTSGDSQFRDDILGPRMGDSGEVYLVDSKGGVIYHSDASRIGDDFSGRAIVQQVLNGAAGALRARDSEDQNIVISFSPVPGTPWGLVAQESWSALTGAGRAYQPFFLVLLGLGVVVPVVVASFGVRQITKPIQDLTNAAQEVARGDFSHRIDAPTGDELEILAEQFNLMAACLQESYANLEQKVADRTRELSTLLDISHNVASHLDLGLLLGVILDQLKSVVDYDGASILTLDGDSLIVLAYRGPIPEDKALELRFALDEAKVNHEVIKSGEPVIIPDVRGDTPLAHAFQQTAGDELETIFRYVRSWMGVPLFLKGQVLGMLSFDHNQPDHYQPAHAELGQVFANQVAVAIENARLYAETRRRADEIQTLFSVQQAIASPLEWEAVLQLIAEEARRLTSTRFSAVFLLDGDDSRLSVFAGEPIPGLPVGHRTPVDRSLVGSAIESRRPLLIENAQNDPRLGSKARQVAGMNSLLVIPLLIDSRSIGAILVADKSPAVLGPDDERVLTMLASGAVIQLENARLFIQAQQVATVEERQRLARELHDAVTQTLFSASLIAEVLPRIWERNPEEGRRRLEELRQLTRGALAEMRTLLLELRPAALMDTEMGDLLRQLAESITGRARVPVSLEVDRECDLPPEVKIVLYRISQEALNNIAKHAGADQAVISLNCQGRQVVLCIRDNGRGFDLTSTPPESLGLGIMRERAESIGSTLEIESEPGQGTRLTVVWPNIHRKDPS